MKENNVFYGRYVSRGKPFLSTTNVSKLEIDQPFLSTTNLRDPVARF